VETFTFLFADIEGSTALLRRLRESLYAQVLTDHRSLIRSGLAAHGGREVDTQGDGLFAVFSSPSACLAAVIDMQRALEIHAWPAGERVRVRMGIHTGEASKTATGLVGLDVHRAARVAAVGYGGQAQASRANGENSDTVAINLGWVRRLDGDHDGARSSFEDALRMSRRNGERAESGYAVLGLACLAADAGEWSRACMLHGIAQACLDRSGEPWQEPEARYRRESLAQVRAHLSQEQSERDYARGRALSADEILDLASRKDPRPGP
jgi:hypothetical protein